jgi:hypothetical protein
VAATAARIWGDVCGGSPSQTTTIGACNYRLIFVSDALVASDVAGDEDPHGPWQRLGRLPGNRTGDLAG